MMKESIFEITENRALKPNVHRLVLEGDTSAVLRPGMFADIKVPGRFLRRPLSVCDWDGQTVSFVYKTVGGGTDILVGMEPGQKLDVLTGLGNGFDTALSGSAPLLIGGGMGFTPLYCLAKVLIREGKHVHVILGFNTGDEVIYEDEFRALGAEVTVCTADGSCGTKGFVTAAMKDIPYSYFYSCGPGPMFSAVNRESETSGQFSLEARMGCGFGACMGCSIETVNGPRRVCKDGPVFKKEELIWQT